MNNLGDEQHYNNLYDLHTIEECLQSHKFAIKSKPQKPKGSRVKAIRIVTDLLLITLRVKDIGKSRKRFENGWLEIKKRMIGLKMQLLRETFIVILVQTR